MARLRDPDPTLPTNCLERVRELFVRHYSGGGLRGCLKSCNGVAILARGADPIEIRRGLPGDSDYSDSRYIEAAVNGVLVGYNYLPNGNAAPGRKFDHKMLRISCRR